MSTCLIIRAQEEAQKTAKMLETRGFKAIIEPIFSVKKLAVDVTDKNPQALIITSSNACEAVINSGFTKDVKIFAVGQQSAQQLAAKGYSNITYSPENSAASLNNIISASLDPLAGRILYFCGDTITLDFQLELEPLSFRVAKILAYKIKWHENFSPEFLTKIGKEPLNFILFYSQNSLKNFHRLAKNNNLLEYFGDSTLLCLSDKIAVTAKELGFKKIGDFKILQKNHQ